MPNSAPPARPRVNLALQGGGAHGAFTWGVLDRLLEDGGLEVAGICGTSAGAMNGVAVAYGLARGGPRRHGHPRTAGGSDHRAAIQFGDLIARFSVGLVQNPPVRACLYRADSGIYEAEQDRKVKTR